MLDLIFYGLLISPFIYLAYTKYKERKPAVVRAKIERSRSQLMNYASQNVNPNARVNTVMAKLDTVEQLIERVAAKKTDER